MHSGILSRTQQRMCIRAAGAISFGMNLEGKAGAMSERYGISQPVRRSEDVRFLTGRGTYADDVNAPGQCYASFVRSAIAHGTIRSIDFAEARRAPGVIAVFTGQDLVSAGLKG